MGRIIRVGLVDDHEIVRQGLVSLIKAQEGVRVLFDLSNGAELLEALKESTKPDVIILDIEMPGVDGRQALQVIHSKYPDIKVIMFSMHNRLDFISECISMGAHGFLSKDCDFDKMVDAIYSVHHKGFYLDEVVSKALVKNAQMKHKTFPNGFLKSPLDTIDIQIIDLICKGKNSIEIADIVCLSKRTVQGRRLRISKKTDTANTIELVVYAIKHGIFKIY